MPSSVHYRPSACRLLHLTLGLLTLPGSAFAGGQPTAEGSGGRPYHAVKVAKNAVTLPSLPDFRLHVPDEFSFLGATSFNLDGKAEADVFVGTRLARVFAEGRSELLLLYGESTNVSGVDCGDEKAAMKHLPAILARSDAALTLVP